MTKFGKNSSKLFSQLTQLLFYKTHLKICPNLGPNNRSPLELGYIRFIKRKPPKTYFSSAATLHPFSRFLWEYVHPISTLAGLCMIIFMEKCIVMILYLSFWSGQSIKDDNEFFFTFYISNLKNQFLDIRITFIQNSNRYFRFLLKEL